MMWHTMMMVVVYTRGQNETREWVTIMLVDE